MRKWFGIGAAAVFLSAGAAAEAVKLEAESGRLDGDRLEVVDYTKLNGGTAVTLKKDVKAAVDETKAAPDLVLKVKVPAGRYVMQTYAVTDAEGEELMAKAKGKHESMFMKLQIDDGVPVKRVVYVPWNRPLQTTGKFHFGPKSELKIWLPRGVRLDWIELTPYVPPKAPAAAEKYRPAIVPAKERPRLWVNPATLAQVRKNLSAPENRKIWEGVKTAAAESYSYTHNPAADIQYDEKLEQLARNKAFVYLMTGDRKVGREAVDLMLSYLPYVEFGNLLDITREIGRAMVAASWVYDYCYDLMTPAERRQLADALMRLADDMEIGWPPFKQTIVNGHGAEAQINRDLLTMAIALYGDNDIPYRYCSYRILEELVPMRAFEYQSNRHNQGVGYGTYRFNFEMHAAWLMRRMAGREVFDPNIKTVYLHWLYGRLPDGSMMLDGDGSFTTRKFQRPQTTFMCYSYAGDPLFKGEFLNQGGKPDDPLVFLLLNDPALKAEYDLNKLPLVHHFQKVLPSVIFRTGWNLDDDSSDVFIEMKGGGYGFANHQHVDAGAFQIFHRGVLATDLGMYKFSNTPYDFGFNKRSIPHNVMLVYNPDEKFGRGNPSNDGGQRVVERTPASVKMLTTDPEFKTGETLAAAFGPDAMKPDYVFFKSNLAPAYSDKVEAYTRSFCALRFDDGKLPAALITVDRLVSSRADFKKYYLLNTLTEPKSIPGALEVTSNWKKNPGKMTFRMLLPENAEVKTVKGKEVTNVFGTQLPPPDEKAPQARGCRTSFSPASPAKDDLFVAVMLIGEDGAKTKVQSRRNAENIQIDLADAVVVIGTELKPAAKPFELVVPDGRRPSRVVLADLAPGKWVVAKAGKEHSIEVNPEEHAAFLELTGGTYQVRPRK